MKVLLTGATGLLGGALLGILSRKGCKVSCLVRENSPNLGRLDTNQTRLVYGDAGHEDSLVRALDGMDALLHVAGIEYAPRVISAMRKSGVGRLVMVGSTSVHSAYDHRSGWRRRMESLVRESGLDWTIVRPTMIYGSELDKNMHKLLRFLDRSPVFPVFGPGANLWQPVYYKDLARGIMAALETPEAVRQGYDLPGAEPLTYLDLVQTAARALGRKPRILRLPLEPVEYGLRLAEAVRLPLPVKSEQVMRLREDKAYPYEEARQDLGYAPRAFSEGILLEVARLRETRIVK
ncbi:MAG: NAD(P)H-binding protein [Rubrobacteraceae bacterium]